MVARLSGKIHEGPIDGRGQDEPVCFFTADIELVLALRTGSGDPYKAFLLTSSMFWRLGRGVVTPTKPFAMHMLVYVTVAPNGLDLGFF